MPTPFSHLAAIHKLLSDTHLTASYRQALNAQRPAFLLGAVAPDARVKAPDPRAATHFYTYRERITTPPWRVMLREYPQLTPPHSPAHRAFLAGYVAHLAMDEIWTVQMLGPHFARSDWGESRQERFFVLHLLLIDMDERDLDALPDGVAADLYQADPAKGWLPFMPLAVLRNWQALIYDQVKPGGESQTLTIFGERVGRAPQELRALADDDDWMQAHLWDHVVRPLVDVIEAQMYRHAREALAAYLDEFTALAP